MTGGESWLSESVQSDWLKCDALDVISIHAYAVTDFYTSSIASYVQQAIAANKKLIMEEWCVLPPSLTSARTGWRWKRTGIQGS